MFALCLFVGVATALQVPASRHHLLWTDHKVRHGLKFNAAEEAGRFKCFSRNVDLVDTYNTQEDDGAFYELNQFAHFCHTEFSAHYKGLLMPENHTRNPIMMPANEAKLFAAKAIDWRTKGAVTHVKDQGQCGSCWAFSAVGNMEGLNFLRTGTLVELSEEELVQCAGSTGNEGCNGGLMDNAFDWVAKNGGIDTEADYPYTSKSGTGGACKEAKLQDVAAKFSGHVDIASDEEQMAAWVAQNGPLSIAVDAGPMWQMYSKGIKKSCYAGTVDHGVLIVGFGEEKGIPYWIVKNSWGAGWGEQGYIRIRRGKNCNNIKKNPSSAKI